MQRREETVLLEGKIQTYVHVYYIYKINLHQHYLLHCGLSSVQSLSRVQLFAISWAIACQASLSIINSQSLLKFVFIQLVMLFIRFTLWHPLLLALAIFPGIRVFSNESVLHIRWPKYWSFSLIISPSNKYSGLTSFRMGWLDLLAVQGILKSLLQYHNLKA